MKKIRVVHLCVTDEGGAGLCCRRISQAMQGQGVTSRVLTMLHFSNDLNVTRVNWGIRWFLHRVINKILFYLQLPITDQAKIVRMAELLKQPLSMPVTSFKGLEEHPLIQNADVVHLHSVAGFVDYPTFFRRLNKPIVWTLHDENVFNGLAHFSKTKIPNLKLDQKYYDIKLHGVQSAKNIGFVFLSDMMYEKYHSHEMVAGRKITVINNPVDTELFKPVDKDIARKKFGIAKDTLVFVFVAAFIEDPWKGLLSLCETFKRMNLSNALILAIGKKTEKIQLPSFVKAVGPIYGGENLSIAYSTADFFISASTQEAFAQTPIEAMACGIPAILTPVSGTSELINDTNGVRCEDFSSESMENTIKQAMGREYDAKRIREDVVNRFSTNVIASKYLSFYKEIIGEN